MSRITKLQQKLAKLYVDAFLVTNQQNIYYLTGFNLMQDDGCLLVLQTMPSSLLMTAIS